MRPIGPILKRYIEENSIKKSKIAEKVGITYNYLSTIFHKETLDSALLEKLCVATGLNPMVFFETGENGEKVHYSDIQAKTKIGSAAVNINHNSSDCEKLLAEKERLIEEKNRLIEEKERTIQILMAAAGIKAGSDLGQ